MVSIITKIIAKKTTKEIFLTLTSVFKTQKKIKIGITRHLIKIMESLYDKYLFSANRLINNRKHQKKLIV